MLWLDALFTSFLFFFLLFFHSLYHLSLYFQCNHSKCIVTKAEKHGFDPVYLLTMVTKVWFPCMTHFAIECGLSPVDRFLVISRSLLILSTVGWFPEALSMVAMSDQYSSRDVLSVLRETPGEIPGVYSPSHLTDRQSISSKEET